MLAAQRLRMPPAREDDDAGQATMMALLTAQSLCIVPIGPHRFLCISVHSTVVPPPSGCR